MDGNYLPSLVCDGGRGDCRVAIPSVAIEYGKRFITINLDTSLLVRFADPNARLPNELRSKLIKPDSSLYKWLAEKRKSLVDKYGDRVGPMRMDFHVELIRKDEAPTDVLLLTRCRALESYFVEESTLSIQGKAVVLSLYPVVGYGPTHITVAYFPAGTEGVEL